MGGSEFGLAQPAFDEGDGRYKACCRGCHVQTASIVIGFVELLWCVFQVFGLFRNFSMFGSSYWLWLLIGLFGVLMFVIVIALLFYAVKTQNAFWVIPHLTAQAFLIVMCIAAVIVIIFLLFFREYSGIRRLLGYDGYQMSDDWTFYVGILLIVFYLAVAILEMWFFVIVFRYYQYLKEKDKASHDRTRFIAVVPPPAHTTLTADDFYAPKQQDWNDQPIGYSSQPNFGHGSPEAGDVYPYGNKIY